MHRSHLNSLCAYTSKNLLLLTREDIQGWIDFQVAESSESEKPESTIAYRFAGIRAFYSFMLQSGRISSNPTDRINVPRAVEPEMLWIEESEAEQLLAAPRRAHVAGDISLFKMILDRLILELLYGSGLRVSEAIRLKTGDLLREDRGGVDIRMAFVRSKQHGDRSVPLTKTCIKALEKFLDQRPESRDDNLLVTQRGFPLKPDYFQSAVFEYVCREGMDQRISPHKLRHSFAMAQLARGIDLESLRQLLGNKSIATLERYLEQQDNCYANCTPLSIPV